jgi:hypothetical protein
MEKNMKYTILIGSLIVTCANVIIAEVPNFSLKNKSGQSIVIELTRSAFTQIESPKVKCVLRDIENEKKGETTEMLSDYCQIGADNLYKLQNDRSIAFFLPEAKMPETMYNLNIWYDLDKKSVYSFELKQGQTFYAKISTKGSLEAQAGTGLVNKKTTEGFSLKNNIKIPKPTTVFGKSYTSKRVQDFDTMHIR